MTRPARSSDDLVRVASVTGANPGIGLEVCRQLAERDFVVLLTARDAAKANTAAKKLAKIGTVEPVALDVANASNVKKDKYVVPSSAEPICARVSLTLG